MISFIIIGRNEGWEITSYYENDIIKYTSS